MFSIDGGELGSRYSAVCFPGLMSRIEMDGLRTSFVFADDFLDV